MLPAQCSCSPLRRLTRRITVIYDRHLQGDELTITQYSLLASLARLGPIANIRLAAEMGMDRSTLSRNLKPLIGADWIEMVDMPEDEEMDKRSFGLQLTAAGRKKWQAAKPNWQRAQDEIDRQLGKKMAADLTALIDNAYLKLQEE
ncbi:MarR family transcriptional regulator [Herbaspirillum lusitanum]|uniref:MarR family transcriptional regulator n=1 Tax=Herbaspirillum lusitanum TaxID=213312 RepID=A0ABW9ACP9_9BURK